MIELKLRKTYIRLDFSFFAVVALFLLLDASGFGISALCACALHELAHLIAMTLFGISAEQITFYGAGIRITSSATKSARPFVEALILLAGCAANFASAAVLMKFGCAESAAINLLTGIFNLLPIGELDGAGLLKMFAIRCCAPENVDKILKIAGAVSAAVIMSAVIIFGGEVSFTLITTVIYIIIVGSRKI